MAANVRDPDPSEELVTQFCAVTGADQETGRQMLAICHGNLGMAIGMHMDQNEEAGADTARSSGSGARSRPLINDGLEPGAAATASGEDDSLNGIRAPIPQRHEVLVEEAPKYSGFRGVRRTRRSVFDGFRDFQAEARQQEEMLASGRSCSKKHTLEDLFRPPIDMTYKGTFHTAREAGTSQNKWLLVNIQNVQEFACQVLNRDIWSNITIKALVKKHFIFWQVYHDSDEGKKYMQFYKVQNWPHVAVIDPVTGENLVTWDKVEPASFADLLRDFITEQPNPENSEGPPAKRQKRSSSIVDASEEAQLEAAIKASLSSHQQKQAASSSSSSTQVSSAAVVSAVINIDSDVSDFESDELETFTGSEDESRGGAPSTCNSSRSGREETPTSSQRRNFSAVSSHNVTSVSTSSSSYPTSGNRLVDGGVASSGAAGASGGVVSSPHHSSLPSTSAGGGSSSRDVAHILVEDSENDSLGFRGESFGNTPNSVDILGSRSSEFHTLDSSSGPPSSSSSSPLSASNNNSNSSFAGIAGGRTINIDSDEDTAGCDRLARGEDASRRDGEEEPVASGSPAWHKHYGDANDPLTNLIVRFPDGKKEQLSLPCSSKLQALFVFCSSKGFGQDSYELVVNFPRRSLSSLNPSSTVAEANLHPQETVFVQAR